MNKELSRFVYDALSAGKNRTDISQVLTGSGWAKSEVSDALAAWAETDFIPPVPRPHATASARDFFVYALTFGMLLFGSIYLITLAFQLVDMWFEETTEMYQKSQIRWSIAALSVSVPTYLWLALKDGRAVAADPGLRRSVVRRWLTYITLLFAAAAFLGNVMSLIYALLTGDLSGQFMLKALSVAAVAGAVFRYYLKDIRLGEDG